MASTSDSLEIVSEKSDNSESDDEHLKTTVSILDKLKSPTASDLHRKRKMKCNPPRGLKKRSTTTELIVSFRAQKRESQSASERIPS